MPAPVEPHGCGFAVRFPHWRDRTIDEEAFRQQLGVPADDDPVWSQDKTVVRGPAGMGAAGIDEENDLFLRAFRELGLVLGQPRDSGMGRGFDVRCPWQEEHTDRVDSGTFFAPGRGFRCHHGHCDGRGLPELPARLNELLIEDNGGLVTLAGLDFDEVDLVGDPVHGRLIPVGKRKRVAVGGETYELSEDGLALAFVDEHQDRLRWDNTRGLWLIWGRHWLVDGVGRVFHWARELARRLRQDQEGAKALAKIAAASAIERAARSDPRVATVLLDWDKDQYAIGTADVHVDLRTGAMRPLEPRDLMQRSTLVAPDPEMATPIWDKFLWETFGGDIDQIEWLHQWFGYCLTGDVTAEMLVFLYGTGGNGKGTVIDTITAIAGDYATPINTGMLMQRKFEAHETEIARLCGARLIFGSELNKDARWDAARLKRLASKEGKMTGRFMHKNHFDFPLTGKLTITANHKPVIEHVDSALERRLVLWPFPFQLEKAAMDASLKDRLVPEYPGILWKLIVGANEALGTIAGGGSLWNLVPQTVVEASREYLVEEDHTALWLKERCVKGGSVGATEAHKDYETWCNVEGHIPISVRKISAEAKRAAGLAGMLIEVRHTETGSVWQGVSLKG
jgi:putative DNA primase/helicase